MERHPGLRCIDLVAVTFLLQFTASAQSSSAVAPLPHTFIHVALPSTYHHAVSGRLLLFAMPGSRDASVDLDMMSPTKVYVAAKEIVNLAPGEEVDIDADDVAFPGPLSKAAPGAYEIQAVLDIHNSYNYDGRTQGDLISNVVSIAIPAASSALPKLSLSQTVPPPPDPLAHRVDVADALKPIDFVSPELTRFWGREIHMRGWVLLPPGYDPTSATSYPTVYFTHGFGGTLLSMRARFAPVLYDRMKQGRMPGMIWVLLDESSPTGTHEFADSVNNGPWGSALIQELIPHLEEIYRMDARTNGRFLQGHSSGGWATLWLQTRYPTIFGGTWSTSPDPSDFRVFSTIDLYAPNSNMFTKQDGTPQPIMREHGQPLATMQQLAGLEAVIGAYGGQLASFEWVFSPRGSDGRPQPLFDRTTGVIDPAVAAYWQSHYDIVEYLKTNWSSVGSDVKGKIHLFVGTDDTFYLDGAAHSLQSTLEQLGGEPHFEFLPGRSHFDLYVEGKDQYALFDRIAAAMYQIARPRSQ